MNIYSITLIIVSILYGGSSIFAGSVAAINYKKTGTNVWSGVLMFIGGILVITAPITKLIYLIFAGVASIHVSAINNGMKMYGRINIRHHFMRLAISIAVVVLCILSK